MKYNNILDFMTDCIIQFDNQCQRYTHSPSQPSVRQHTEVLHIKLIPYFRDKAAHRIRNAEPDHMQAKIQQN